MKRYFASERTRIVTLLMKKVFKGASIDPLSDELSGLDLAELEQAIQEQQDENNDDWDDVLLMLLLLVAASFTSVTVNELGETYDGTPADTTSWTETFLKATLILIAATTLKKIIQIISDAKQAQQSVNATIVQINDAYSKFIKNRAPGIAGDLVGKVASMAQQIAVHSLDIPPEDIRQVWVSMRDDRVRDSHQELDGEVRSLGEEFKPDLKFPRDPNGPIEETINCRCWLMIEQVQKEKQKAA